MNSLYDKTDTHFFSSILTLSKNNKTTATKPHYMQGGKCEKKQVKWRIQQLLPLTIQEIK